MSKIIHVVGIIAVSAIVMSIFISLTACTTQKEVIRTEKVYDSTVVRDLLDSVRIKNDVIYFYEQAIKGMETTGIQFVTDTLYRDTGRVITNRVVIKSDGTIEAEGRIRSLNIEKIKEQREKSLYQKQTDSLAIELDRTRAELSKKETVKIVQKETRFIPWWVWLMVVVAYVFGDRIRSWWNKKRLL